MSSDNNSKYWVEHLFRKYDKDKSGTIDQDELSMLCFDLGFPVKYKSFLTTLSQDWLVQLFLLLLFFRTAELEDILLFLAPTEGVIDFDAFFTWWTSEDKFRKLGEREQEIMNQAVALFQQYDLDRSGTLRKDEFLPLAERFGFPPETFSVIDVNGDGKVTFNEFIDWLGWFKEKN